MIAFVVAMGKELACLSRHLEGAREGSEYGRLVLEGAFAGRPAIAVVSGVGKVNAAAATQIALAHGPEALFNFGLCGGFGRAVELGGIYEVARAVEYDFDLAELNGTAPGVLDERKTPYLPFAAAGRFPALTLASGDRFRDGDDDLALLGALGADLRDMEGAAIAHVCETAGFASVHALKCVSDVHGAASMTGQYLDEASRCLAALADVLPDWVASALDSTRRIRDTMT